MREINLPAVQPIVDKRKELLNQQKETEAAEEVRRQRAIMDKQDELDFFNQEGLTDLFTQGANLLREVWSDAGVRVPEVKYSKWDLQHEIEKIEKTPLELALLWGVTESSSRSLRAETTTYTYKAVVAKCVSDEKEIVGVRFNESERFVLRGDQEALIAQFSEAITHPTSRSQQSTIPFD